MSNNYLFLFLLIATLLPGCQLLKDIDPYKAGRAAASAYLAADGVVNDKHLDTVRTVYRKFNELLDKAEGKDISKFPDELKETLEDVLPADKYATAVRIIDRYWAKLEAHVNTSDLGETDMLVRLNSFRQGTEDELKERGYVR